MNNTGLTTIEEVRETFKQSFNGCHLMTKIQLKCWLNHSESRNRNGNPPFTFNNYTHHLRDCDCLEQVELNMIDCFDIGGKEEIIKYLQKRIYA